MSQIYEKSTTGFLPSSDGILLFFRCMEAQAYRGVAVFIHGFGEHSGRYSYLSYKLKEAGFSNLGIDLRGHGRSLGARGCINSFQQYFHDIACAIDHARDHFKVDKVFVIAHSMGGLLASFLAASQKDKLSGLVLSSPAFGLDMSIPLWKSLLGRVMSLFWPSFSLPSNIKGNHLTKDPYLLNYYHNDPLVLRRVTSRLYVELVRHHKKANQAAKELKVPLFMQLSAEDQLVSISRSREFFEMIAVKDKRFKLYNGFLHEIYNEVGRDIPISDLIEWMKSRS